MLRGKLSISAGDTNKFLREDCHLALDAMVENLSPARVIAVITTEDVLNHKNPTVRYGSVHLHPRDMGTLKPKCCS